MMLDRVASALITAGFADFSNGREAARVAVEAMREPTEDMLVAARGVVWDFSPDDAPIESDPLGERDGSAEEVAGRAFNAMIDAALQD